ncbi:MAG: nitrite reductase small subunit NirD [Acidobacteria bacterium]|nr:nitrite reductase small subunit NirD [Acidobacteriota bacterium]
MSAKQWIRITYAKDIPLREGRAVSVGNREIAIFNLGDRFVAIDSRCPHRGGPLSDGIVSGTAVVCPLHGWRLSLENGQGLSPASSGHCVSSFPTRVEEGVVLVELPEAHGPGKRAQGAAETGPGDSRQWSIPLEAMDEAWAAQE